MLVRTLHFDELPAVELVAKARGVSEDRRPDETGLVLKRQRDERLAGSPVPDVFIGAEKKAPPFQLGRHRADEWKAAC